MDTSRVQVVIVDDDPSVGRAVARLVRSLGMNPSTFTSGEDFLRSVECAAPPDCVVLDVQMPGLTGLEVQRRLHALDLPLPVIFITAHEDGDARRQALAAGAVGYLLKPFSDATLCDMIDLALAHQA